MYRFLKDNLRPIGIWLLPVLLILAVSFDLLGQNQNKPDTEITVKEFNPLGASSQHANITIKFSNDLVSKDSLETIVTNPPIEISPPIAGVARWIETDMLRFYPDDPLLPATEYTVKIKRQGTYVNGNRIAEKKSFSFYTDPLQVTSLYSQTIPEPTEPGTIRLSIYINFNYRVKISELKCGKSIWFF